MASHDNERGDECAAKGGTNHSSVYNRDEGQTVQVAGHGERGYNAGMGAKQAREIDAWLREGGVVVTASDRAARAISSAYHHARLDEGLKAWIAPEVMSWQRFAGQEWEQRSADGRLVLNAIQERAIWADLVVTGGHAAATLSASRHRLAAMAMEAHALLCSYSNRLLDARARRGWLNDAAAFSEWLAGFDEACGEADALSEGRVPLELIEKLKSDPRQRPPLLLAGFDRVLPVQHELFEAWGDYQRLRVDDEHGATRFYTARDAESELSACALWCRARLAENPQAKLLVVTQDAGTRRGEIERTLLEYLGPDSSLPFEFSLGVPLGEIAIARTAVMLLRWLDGGLAEHQLDWILSTAYAVASAAEADALQARMRDLRRHKKQRAQWSLRSFTEQFAKPAVPTGWSARMREAQVKLQTAAARNRSPLEWAELVPQLLAEVGWPGKGGGSSAEFQAARRLQRVVDLCGSLGFDGRQVSWRDYLAELERALEETLFSAESQDAPILIAGPSESAGLSADAIWFLGVSEEAWPARGNLHPLLPAGVQREASMPHASPQLDWELAQAVTTRLLASAREIFFSYPLQVEGADLRPSRIVRQIAGTPEPVPMGLVAPAMPAPLAIRFEDEFQIPLLRGYDTPGSEEGGPPYALRGGARILTMQSHCPFKAFATSRLGGEEWEPAEAGLTALERGNLLHAVMQAIWGGPPRGIRTFDELQGIPDRRAFVAARVDDVMRFELPDAAREQMPQRYLDLEAKRLTRLVTEWLDYEAARAPFTVVGTELKTLVDVGGLRLEVRLDRIDRLNDGSLLVVDYKTGDINPKVWDAPRPEDVQLPLYGSFALEPDGELGGLAFAKVRAGDVCFAGRVGDPAATLGYGLKNLPALVKKPFTAEQLMEWRDEILRLTSDYIEGRADVDPRDPKATCDRCGLHSLCRIQEQEVAVTEEEEEVEDADE